MNDEKQANEKLHINQVLGWLEADGLVSETDLEKCRQFANVPSNKDKHPLKIIAEAAVQDKTQQGKLLTLENLTSWLADKVNVPYYYIDPLKIDIPTVTALYSKNYAFNYNILPIMFSKTEIVIATAEPYVRSWEADLIRMHNRPIKRVLSNPDEISRYLGEFYSFAKSLKGATLARSEDKATGNIQNFEQLLELSKTSDLDANNQHIVNLVNWLLQFAFDQRASDIHIEPRRVSGNVRFRIDGILHEIVRPKRTLAQLLVHTLKQCGDDLTRENVMRQAANMRDLELPMLLPGIKINTSPTDFYPIEQVRLLRFNGTRLDIFGEVIGR